MLNTELQLFDNKELNSTVIKQNVNSVSPLYNPQKSLEESLNSLFPTHQEETKLQKARRILEEVANGITDEQLETFLTEIQYLVDSWLDRFERDMFSGLTLKQILKGE